jgi:hypothetical protein
MLNSDIYQIIYPFGSRRIESKKDIQIYIKRPFGRYEIRLFLFRGSGTTRAKSFLRSAGRGKSG